MRALCLAAAVSAAMLTSAAAPLSAQQTQTAADLGWFHGEWEGEVDFIGRPAKGRLSIRPALVGSATALTFTADVAEEGDKPAFRFEGQGTYRIKPDGTISGLWADSYGNFHHLKGRSKPGELRVTWGDARSEVGHSSYILSPDGVLRVTDSAFVQGEVRVFGSATYRKRD